MAVGPEDLPQRAAQSAPMVMLAAAMVLTALAVRVTVVVVRVVGGVVPTVRQVVVVIVVGGHAVFGVRLMVATAGDEVVGVQEGFGGEVFDVLVAGGVDDAVALTAGPDQVGGAQLGQVLGYGGRASTDMLGELVDGVLAVQQRPHDLQPGRVGEQLEHTGGNVKLDVRRLDQVFARLRSHAGDPSPAPGGVSSPRDGAVPGAAVLFGTVAGAAADSDVVGAS